MSLGRSFPHVNLADRPVPSSASRLRSAGMMLSSKPPPYDLSLVGEARDSAQKVEQSLWGKASSPTDYVAKVNKKLQGISTTILRTTPSQTQRAHYDAAMAQMTPTSANPIPPPEDPTPPAPKPADDPQLAATLELFDRKNAHEHQQMQSQSPAPVAQQTSASKNNVNAIVQAILKRYVDRPNFKAYIQGLPVDQRKATLGKLVAGIRHLLERYHQQLAQRRDAGQQTSGLSDAALIEYIAGNLAKIMAKAGGAGATTVGVGLHHAAQMRREAEATVAAEREASAAAARQALRDQAHAQAARVTSHAGTGPMGSTTLSVHEMAAYWKRLGEMRGAYLPRAKQTLEQLKKKARAANGVVAKNAQKFILWLNTVIIPMLSQTAEMPCPTAKFTTAELDQLDAQMKKLIAMTLGRTSAAAQGSTAGLGHAVARSTAKIATSSDQDEPSEKSNQTGDKYRERVEGKMESEWAKRAKTGDAAEAETGTPARTTAAKAAEVQPSAFANILRCDEEWTTGRLLPAAMEALNALRSMSPQTSAFARGAPMVFEGKSGLAEAVLFSGDAPEYHSPDGEMLRREFETLADGDSSALWKLWEDVLAAK